MNLGVENLELKLQKSAPNNNFNNDNIRKKVSSRL